MGENTAGLFTMRKETERVLSTTLREGTMRANGRTTPCTGLADSSMMAAHPLIKDFGTMTSSTGGEGSTTTVLKI